MVRLKQIHLTAFGPRVPCVFLNCLHRVQRWLAIMQIYQNKRKSLYQKRVQLPQDRLGSPTWSVILFWNTNTAEVTLCESGGVCGRAVNTSNSRSGVPGFTPRPSRCFLRQGALLHFVSLHSGVQMGTGDILLRGWGGGGGVTLRWSSFPSRRE